MTGSARPKAVVAAEAPPRERSSNYPEPFASRMDGRIKRPLGDLFGLTNFGVNLTTLRPGAVSSLRHAHSRQDELVYILEGEPTLVTNEGETVLRPGMAAGFKAAPWTRTTWSTAPTATWSISRSAIAPPATRWSTPTTTSAPPSPTVAGASSTRMGGRTEAQDVDGRRSRADIH